MNIVKLITTSSNNKPEGNRAELIKAIQKERFLRQSMIDEGSPLIKKAREGALSISDGFSRQTKDLIIEDRPFQKLLTAVDNILNNEGFAKQLKSLLELSKIKDLLSVRKTDFQETLKIMGKPDMEFLFSQKIIPEEKIEEITNFITKNELKPKESLTLLYKELIKNFNLEEYRNTFTRLLTSEIKKIK